MKASSLVISIALSGTVAVVGQAHTESPSGDPISVTVDNFIRAESDLYLGNITKDGGFGKFNHRREPATIEKPGRHTSQPGYSLLRGGLRP